jgi:hypothetical protein
MTVSADSAPTLLGENPVAENGKQITPAPLLSSSHGNPLRGIDLTENRAAKLGQFARDANIKVGY